MARESMANFLSVNQSLVNPNDEQRQFRLPQADPSAKSDQGPVRSYGGARRVGSSGMVIIGSANTNLPEMASDVIDAANNYAVENVRRERSQSATRAGLGHLVGRVLGSHHAARP